MTRGTAQEPTGSRSAGVARPRALDGASWRVVVPGLPHWSWGQNERGLTLFLSWLTALGAAAFAWGTGTGLVLLVFAYLAHVVSMADAWSQAAFPSLGRWAPWLTAAGGMGAGLYLPAVAIAAWVAWPAVRAGERAEGYLVNCWAYRGATPAVGDRVWFRPNDWSDPRLGLVLAGPRQEVDWSENRLRVDGKSVHAAVPYRSQRPPHRLRYRVPDRHLLVSPERKGRPSGGTVLLRQDRVVGRAWAQFYPVLDRRLLD